MTKTFEQIKLEIIEEVEARIDDRAYKYGTTREEVENELFKSDWEREITEMLKQALPGTRKTYKSILAEKQINKMIYKKVREFPKD
jgi:signal recognition particle GTPase